MSRPFILSCLVLLLATPLASAGGWLVITEIDYCTAAADDGGEFIEIYSADPPWIDLSGYVLEGDAFYRFPEGTRIDAGETIVVARDPERLRARAPAGARIFGPWEGELGNRNGEVRLRSRKGVLAASARWGCTGDWPAACSGAGHTLTLRDSYSDPLDPRSWSPSLEPGGTPCAPSLYRDGNIDLRRHRDDLRVLIDEVVPGPTGESMVEVRNLWPLPVDLGGFYITSHPRALDAVRIPDGTMLAGYSHLTLTTRLAIEGELPFVALVDRDGKRVRDAVRIEGAQAGVSFGRHGGLGTSHLVECDEPSPGEPNLIGVTDELVINEIMYHPVGGNLHEYVEIFHRGNEPLDASGFELTGGIRYQFPDGTVLEPGSFTIVARDPGALRKLTRLDASKILGPFEGELSNRGELIELLDERRRVVDEVGYADGGEWPSFADGHGSSLELVHPNLDNSLPGAWRDSDDSAKSDWNKVTYVGEHREFKGKNIQELQFMLLGPGEILIDDVMMGARSDLVTDGSFEEGALDWIAAGTHERSGVTRSEAQKGVASYHLIADDAGDPRDNFVTMQIERGLVPDRQYRIRFRVKWLKGCPLLLTRTGGQGVAQLHELERPAVLGTPGAPNSAALGAPTPVIGDVTQWPASPAPDEPVTVRARVSGEGRVAATLHWRFAGDPDFQPVKMMSVPCDEDGDESQGWMVGVVPGEAAVKEGEDGRLVEMWISIEDQAGGQGCWPPRAPEDTAVFQSGVTRRSSLPLLTLLAAPRQWKRLETSPRMSDQLLYGSLVVNRDRIIHGVGFRRRGSPFHRKGGGNWRVELPRYHTVDGRTALNLDNQGLGTKAGRGLQERTVFWLLDQVGEPNVRLRFVDFRIPGREEGVFEEVERVTGGYRDRWWPGDADGHLHKVDDYFELLADGTQEFIEAQLVFKGLDQELYRWNFPRMGRASEEDYEPLMRMIAFMDPAATGNAPFGRHLDEKLNWVGWARTLAVRSYCDDWDSMGSTRGKNAFLYYPLGEKRWQLIAWDCDLTFANPDREWVPDRFPAIVRLVREPRVRRVFLGTLWYCANGPLLPANVEELLRSMAGPSDAPMERMLEFTQRRHQKLSEEFPGGPELRVSGNKRQAGRSGGVDRLMISGVAPPPVMRFFLEGREFDVEFVDAARFTAEVPIGPEGGKLELVAADAGGRELGKVTIKVSARRQAVPLPRPGLRLEDTPLDPDLDTWRERSGL